MRRSIFSILAGAAFIFLGSKLLYFLFYGQTSDPLSSQAVVTVSIFIGGIITGYLAEKRGFLHGLIAGSLTYLLFLVFIVLAGFVLRFILHATWTGGSPTDVVNALSKLVTAIITAGLIGSLGGYLGGIFHHRMRS